MSSIRVSQFYMTKGGMAIVNYLMKNPSGLEKLKKMTYEECFKLVEQLVRQNVKFN